jgi:dolichyl-phosphate beta-glucosyltransferase
MGMDIVLSVIIPAYNESHRLPPYLASVRPYLQQHYPDGHEVIVVDDGSDDGLAEMLPVLAAEWPELVVMRHPVNRGKGAAIRTGMLAAAGRLLLFADADGAAPIDQEAKLAEAIEAGADLAVGSRLLAAKGVTRRRTLRRALVGQVFARFARWWLRIPVHDTQCGFKMFRHEVGRQLFSCGQESQYLFDLELLVLAEQFGYQIAEVPINWSDIPGGHLRLSRELPGVLRGLWRLRRTLAGHDRLSNEPE